MYNSVTLYHAIKFEDVHLDHRKEKKIEQLIELVYQLKWADGQPNGQILSINFFILKNWMC